MPSRFNSTLFNFAPILFIFSVVVVLSNLGSVGSASPRSKDSSDDGSPIFDVFRIENYTVQMGASAYLPCVIKNLGNRSVSWIRSEDSHILTVDGEVFISDPRYSTIHEEDSSMWTLQIKSVSPSEAGKYECQVSTQPKLSHFVYLTVIVPEVSIYGDRDVFVKSGSPVNLKCVISQSLNPPTYIEWRFADTVLEGGRGGRIQTTPPEHLAPGTTMSTLTIKEARKPDSGVYTCLPAMMKNATVNLHIFESDFPAAMQTSEASRWKVSLKFLTFVAVMTSFRLSV